MWWCFHFISYLFIHFQIKSADQFDCLGFGIKKKKKKKRLYSLKL